MRHYYAETGGAGSSAGWLYDTCTLMGVFNLPPRSSAFLEHMLLSAGGDLLHLPMVLLFKHALFALVRGLLRYVEQNATTLLRLNCLRLLETVCSFMPRKLAPAKLEVKNMLT